MHGERLDPRELFTYYENAERYLEMSLEMDPARWSALLNLGDLQYELNDLVGAIRSYDGLLKVKPDYKYAGKVRQRIEELKRKPETSGVETIVTTFRSGKQSITYTRLDAKTVMRQGYYASGRVRFREEIVDGCENGEYRSWYENGQLSVVGRQEAGQSRREVPVL